MIDDAKRGSPLAFLRRHYQGVEVNRRGDAISIEGVLRADLRDGRWVACDWTGGAIGDNVALAQWVKPGTSFPDAIYELTGAQAEAPTRIQPRAEKPAEIRRPSIPYERGRGAGRAYLRDVRGIAEPTIQAAEAAGMLRYLDNAVLFTGRDEAKAIRSATLRHIEPVRLEDGTLLSKRDLADSDKTFPAVLPGSPRRVVVVEGGINALAARDIAVRAGQEPPTVIATGGVGVRKWVRDNAVLRDLIERADQVEIWGEREVRDGRPDATKQAETDARRDQLATEIAAARQGELPDTVMPPPGVKDAADWNRVQQQPGPEQDPSAESRWRR